jgi:hypothetical protein
MTAPGSARRTCGRRKKRSQTHEVRGRQDGNGNGNCRRRARVRRDALGQLVFGTICMVMIANLQYGWTLFVNPIDQKYHWGRAAI